MLVKRFVAAWERNDVDGLVVLLAADVAFAMPPEPTWFHGRDNVAAFLRRAPMSGKTTWSPRPFEANGQLAVTMYADNGNGPFVESLCVLSVQNGLICDVIAFRSEPVLAAMGVGSAPR